MLNPFRLGLLAGAAALLLPSAAMAACPTAPTYTGLSGLDAASATKTMQSVVSAGSSQQLATPLIHGNDGTTTPKAVAVDANCNLDVNVQTSALPTGAATAAAQASLLAALGSPMQAGGSVGNATFASTSTITSPTNTPTISTSAYTTGFVLGGIMSFTGQPTTGVVANAHVQFASGTFAGTVDLELFTASPTGGGTADHAAYALTATDTAKKIGELHLSDCSSDGGILVSCQNLYQSQFYTLASSGTTIFAVAVLRGTAPTFVGSTDATFGLQVVK